MSSTANTTNAADIEEMVEITTGEYEEKLKLQWSEKQREKNQRDGLSRD